jgi:hypothetical protein
MTKIANEITLARKSGEPIVFTPEFESAEEAVAVVRELNDGDCVPGSFLADLCWRHERSGLSELQWRWLLYLAAEYRRKVERKREVNSTDYMVLIASSKAWMKRGHRLVISPSADCDRPLIGRLGGDKETLYFTDSPDFGEGTYFGRIDRLGKVARLSPSVNCSDAIVARLRAAAEDPEGYMLFEPMRNLRG